MDLSLEMEYTEEFNKLKSNFVRFITLEKGYKLEPVLPLNSRVDSTVFLIGSCTNVFKPYFLSNTIEGCGHALIQPGINTKDIFFADINQSRRFYSTYTILGLLQSVKNLPIILDDSYELITKVVGLDSTKIRLRVNPKDTDFISYIEKKYQFFIGNENCGRHSFGKHNGIFIQGRHISFCYDNQNIAISCVYEYNGEALGVETSTTVQALIAAKNGFQNTMEASVLNDKYVAKTPQEFNYYDCVSAIAELMHSGVKPNSSHMPGRILKKYINRIAALEKELRITSSYTTELINFYIKASYPTEFVSSNVVLSQGQATCHQR